MVFGINQHNWSVFILIIWATGLPGLNWALLASLSLQISVYVQSDNDHILFAIAFGTVATMTGALLSIKLNTTFKYKIILVSCIIHIISSISLLITFLTKNSIFIYMYAVLYGLANIIGQTGKNNLVEQQFRTLAKGTIGHGIRGIMECLFLGISYFIHPYIYSLFSDESQDVTWGFGAIVLFSSLFNIIACGLSIIYMKNIPKVIRDNEVIYRLQNGQMTMHKD